MLFTGDIPAPEGEMGLTVYFFCHLNLPEKGKLSREAARCHWKADVSTQKMNWEHREDVIQEKVKLVAPTTKQAPEQAEDLVCDKRWARRTKGTSQSLCFCISKGNR